MIAWSWSTQLSAFILLVDKHAVHLVNNAIHEPAAASRPISAELVS